VIEAAANAVGGTEVPDLTVLVFDGDLPDRWPGIDRARHDLTAAVVELKATGTRIVAISAATVDPTRTSRAAREQERTAHELDLVLFELSIAEGISVLDVDRIVAELGGRDHLDGFLDYGTVALDRITAGLVAIVEDYGFLEERPLLPQVGAKRR
jgi:hypothetical protein